VQSELAKLDLEGCDGELMVEGDFNNVQSAIMSVKGEPNFTYSVFDYLIDLPFDRRLDIAIAKVSKCRASNTNRVEFLPQTAVHSAKEVSNLYSKSLNEGYEGLILKDIQGLYKYGRSTLKQETMLKLKPKTDDEGVVIAIQELMHNNNEAYQDLLGGQVRSNHQENQVPGGVLGSLLVKFKGVTLSIGSGFDAEQRKSLWSQLLIGKTVTFTHLGLSKYGVPRCPIFKGFRDERDL
jgi:DNA ligase-1